MHLQLTVRTCVCRQPTCARRILPERLPELVAPSARTTTRLIAILWAIGLALGGQVGAWLARHPSITVVCRDRRPLCADVMDRGAPKAI